MPDDEKPDAVVPAEQKKQGDWSEKGHHMTTMMQAFNRMRLDRRQCDVRLRVDSSVFEVHSLVLSAASPFFQAMFSGDWSEESAEEIQLKDVSPEIMLHIINYIYTGETMLSKDNVEPILSAANMYQLEGLKDNCSVFLVKMMDASNCVGIFCMVDAMDFIMLRKKALDFILFEFDEVVSFEEIRQLLTDQLVEIISSDNLNVSSEEVVFRMVVEWINSDSKRKPELHKVLTHVRLSFLPAVFLRDWVSQHDGVKASAECCALIEEALWFKVLPRSRRESLKNTCIKPRPSYAHNYTNEELPPVIFTSVKSSKELLAYDTSSKSWCDRATRHPRSGFACAYLKDKLYMAGGGVSERSPSSWVKVNVGHGWLNLADMNKARADFSLVPYDGYLYAVGGDSHDEVTVERYSPSENKWVFVEIENMFC